MPSGDEEDLPCETDINYDLSNLWQTSLEKFQFAIEKLPQYLQYIYQLLSVSKVINVRLKIILKLVSTC